MTVNNRIRGIGFLALCGLFFNASVLDAQESTDLKSEAELFLQQISECYVSPIDRVEAGEFITVEATINARGDLDERPTLIEPRRATAGERALYRHLLSALFECTPLSVDINNQMIVGKLRVSAGSDGISFSSIDAVIGQAVKVGNDSETPLKMPWIAADASSHEKLDLNRQAIAELQARLSTMKFDPNGIDGIFGRGTRAAISAWQESIDIPSTGYLDALQLEKLKVMSTTNFALWNSNSANKAILDRAARPPTVQRSRNGWYRNNQGLYCKPLLLAIWCQAARPRGY